MALGKDGKETVKLQGTYQHPVLELIGKHGLSLNELEFNTLMDKIVKEYPELFDKWSRTIN